MLMTAAVKGVTIYISDFKRSISDKLNKDFFSEPSQVHNSINPDIKLLPAHGHNVLAFTSRFTMKVGVVLSTGVSDLCLNWSSANSRHQSYIWC